MADRLGDRTASVASSVTEAEENEKGSPILSPQDSSYVKLKTPEELENSNDIERQELLPPPVPPKDQPGNKTSVRVAIIWMVVNTLATIGIVWHTSHSHLEVGTSPMLTPLIRYLPTRRSSLMNPSSSPSLHLPHSISS